MAALPVEVLIGVYLGILTGIIPAVVAWGLGFIFKYFTGVTVPALAVVVLAVAIAGVNGGLLALNDPTVTSAPNAPSLIVAILIVMMMSLYAHAQGDKLGANLPKHISLRKLRERTLSTDVIELVGGMGQVTVTVSGDVNDIEGYPRLPADLRSEIRTREWKFPADLPLTELETRFADKLRTEFDLAEVTVRIDERANATVNAAPPTSGVSGRVPAARRAVSVNALVPTGLARGDEVTVHFDGETVRGTIVSAKSSVTREEPTDLPTPDAEQASQTAPAVSTTDGGDGRVTIATTRDSATKLLTTERAHLVVRSRGTRREFELISLLRRTGKRFRRLTIGETSELVGRTLGDTAIRDTHAVGILASRTGKEWTVAPRGSTEFRPGQELIVVGTTEHLDQFAEVTA